LCERVAEDDVLPRLVRIDKRVTQPRMMVERELQNREIRDTPRPGADVDDVVGLRLDVVRKRIWPGKPGNPEAHATHGTLDQQRRQERRGGGSPPAQPRLFSS